LLQAYDSVAIQSDVEFGGVDQKFNLLVGRELQSILGQRPQQTFMVPLLVGTDGSHKMSKSKGNYIGVAETPGQIYGKVMSVPDTLIMNYFSLLTDVPDAELVEIKNNLENSSVNPMNYKKQLAFELVSQLHGKEEAGQADDEFKRVFQKREAPEQVQEITVSFREIGTPTGVDFSKLLSVTGLVKSRAEANRLISQGAISVDGEKISGMVSPLKSGSTIKVGKHRFVKILNSD
jgi:tyrosyl-tRNA synthetase